MCDECNDRGETNDSLARSTTHCSPNHGCQAVLRQTLAPSRKKPIPQLNASAEVCAIIVTYNPDTDFDIGFAAIADQVRQVIIVDNGSDARSVHMLERLAATGTHILLQNSRNLGIATALNQGVMKGLELGYKWAVTLDQDSIAAPDMVRCEFETLTKYENWSNEVALVGPNIVQVGLAARASTWLKPHPRVPFLFQRVPALVGDLSGVTMILTSGALTNLKVCRELGLFWEDLFIDYVDTEYCLRAVSSGRQILVSREAILTHRLGKRTTKKFAGLRLAPTYHRPLRHYYMWRNRVAVMKRHATKFPHWFLFDVVSATYGMLRILAVEDKRLAKLRAMFFGTIDGFRNVLGPARREIA